MARTADQIAASLIESIQATDPSIDVQKGPVYDFLIQPVPTEIAETEAKVDRIARLVTVQLDQVATTDEVVAMATSFTVPLGTGEPSKGKIVFFTSTRTDVDIPIPRGAIVGTSDSAFTYFVTDVGLVMTAADVDAFFNAGRRRYEIVANIEATSVGPDFDLPPQRIIRLLTPILGIDGCINLDRTSGGKVQEDILTSVERIRAKFAGLDPEIGGGIISEIRNYDPNNITDAALVFPKDRQLFRRRTNRPAVDAYVNGEILTSTTQSLVAVGGEQEIFLTNTPALSVEEVTVNGTAVDFAFLKDSTIEYGGSSSAQDKVILSSPVVLDDVVVITYTYDSLIQSLQTDLFSSTRTFDTSVLARRKLDVPITIEAVATIVPSFDVNRTADAISNALFTEVESGFFGVDLLPEAIRQRIKDSVGGISEFAFRVFQRTSGSLLDVEVVTLDKNEVSSIDQARLVIDVRR